MFEVFQILPESKSLSWIVAIATHLKTSLLCRTGCSGETLSMGSESGVSRFASQASRGHIKDVRTTRRFTQCKGSRNDSVGLNRLARKRKA